MKLLNIGQREIVASVKFLPNDVFDFDLEEAERLRSLYPDEVKSIEDVGLAFKAAPAEAAAATGIPATEEPAPEEKTEVEQATASTEIENAEAADSVLESEGESVEDAPAEAAEVDADEPEETII